jgi:FdhE protein
MMSSNQEASGFDQIMDRALEQNPHSSDLLKAFGPIIARQRQLAASVTLKKLDYSIINKERLKSGVPVSQQISLFSQEDPLAEITSLLVSAVKEGMPSLAEGVDRFCDLILKGKINPADYFMAHPDAENKPMDGWARDLKISPSNVSFLMSLVGRVVLEHRAIEITEALGGFDWEKGYCPICGELPSVALIEEEGGKRFLHCSSCGHDWRFTRVVCPYCEDEASKGMDYFYIENKTQESAFVCEKCKKYLITLYRAGNLHARDMDISAISLIHLDMIMQDKGYEPMTFCAWNVLS